MKVRFALVAVALVLVTPLFAQGPPAESGPYVVRGEFYGGDAFYFWIINDSKRGYVAIHGIDIVGLCEENPSTVFSWWSFQDTHIPADEDLIHQVLKGDDVLTSVWPISIYDNGNGCDGVLALGAPLAQGTVDMVATDNNLWPWLNDSNRANAWKVSGHGVLTAPDGERMVCNSSVRCVWGTGNDGADPGAHCREKVVLN